MTPVNLAHRIDAIQNTAEVIAQSLKEMIYAAELKPGQPLIQEKIAAMFRVSRVPVRDALQLLVRMGIAVHVPRRGVIVRPLSRTLLAELFAVRKILEGAAVRMAARHATADYRRRLEQIVARQAECLKTGDVKRFAALDDEFHRALYDAVGNARLVELVFGNWELIKQARSASTVVPEHGTAWIGNSIRRHRRILAALKKGGEAAACAAVFANIDSSEREIVLRLREVGWIEAAGRGGAATASACSSGEPRATGRGGRQRSTAKLAAGGVR